MNHALSFSWNPNVCHSPLKISSSGTLFVQASGECNCMHEKHQHVLLYSVEEIEKNIMS